MTEGSIQGERLAMPPSPAEVDNSAPQSVTSSRFVNRWRHIAVAMALIALAFIQNPGRVAADTKLDLFVDPGGLMARSLHLWEPLGFFGQLQNQGYGYLFPMGPFYWLFDVIGMPAWITQRLWWSVLLVLAYAGVAWLVALLGWRSFAPQAIGGLAYALAPRMVTEISVLSVEVLPYALAPWVLIPLVRLAHGGSIRRAAGLSGLAVLCVGGVNAVATAAVLPLAAWWIVTRYRGRVRWTLAAWWTAAVVAATAWWALPLALLGRYSPPFLDWIESAAITTALTNPDAVLRGTSAWVAYVAEPGGPVWAAGWALVSTPALIIVSGATAVIGIIGISLRGNPYRLFLLGGLFGGVVLVSLGHVGAWPGFAAETLRTLLDGGLAPLRNTHKFDLVLRLPLALGVAYAVHRLIRARSHLPRLAKGGLIGVTAVVVAGSAPLWTGTSTQDRSFIEIPGYWEETATWLGEQSGDGRALIVPGASFAVFAWGRTNDEPLQALATVPWVVRDAVPLATAGSIRFLDAISLQLDSGRGSPGLAAALWRAGIEWVVVRNDIDQRRTGAPRVELVRQALTSSPGITLRAGFGPVLAATPTDSLVIDRGLGSDLTPVEVFEVVAPASQPDPRFALRSADEVLVLSGASESLLDLADADQLGDRVIVFAGDETPILTLAEPDAVQFGVTDSFGRSMVDFGRSRDNRSMTIGLSDAIVSDRAVTDYLPTDPIGRQATERWLQARVSASSSAAIGVNAQPLDRARGPWSAVDGDSVTFWQSAIRGEGTREGINQWWQARWDKPREMEALAAQFVVPDADTTATQTITVSTEAGSRETVITNTTAAQQLSVPPGPSTYLRLSLSDASSDAASASFGLIDVEVPVTVERIIDTAGQVDGGPILLRAQKGSRSGCIATRGLVACAPGIARPGAERAGLHRSVDVLSAGEYRVQVSVRPRSGSALDDLLSDQATGEITATASSQLTADPAMRAGSLVDGSQETAWIASPDDRSPLITLDWPRPQVIRGVRLGINPELSVSQPLSVTATVNGVPTTGIIDGDGVLRFPSQRATSLQIKINNSLPLRSLDPVTAEFSVLPVGLTEIGLIGQDTSIRGPEPSRIIDVGCQRGPAVYIEGDQALRTRVAMTYGEILADATVKALPCDGRLVTLAKGRQIIEVPSTPEFIIESVLLTPTAADSSGASAIPAAEDVRAQAWEPTHREIAISAAAEPRVLELNENANDGWVATLAGQQLSALRVDGWRQAWWIPAGAEGTVEMRFAPDQTFRAGLLVGAALVAALVLATLSPIRRRVAAVGLPRRIDRRWWIAGWGVLAAGLLAGLPGVGVATATMTVLWLVRRRFAQAAFIVVAIGGSAILAAAWAWPSRAGAPVWVEIGLSTLTVLGLAAAAAPARGRADVSTAGSGAR